MSQALSERVAGLDAWRGVLITAGLFYHALPVGMDDPLFGFVNYLSSHFRMGAFFAISGFVTGLISHRRVSLEWRRQRLAQLLPPFVTGISITAGTVALLAPPAFEGWTDAAIFLFNWYHLWFMAALIAYLPLASWLAFGRAGVTLHDWLVRTSGKVGSVQLTIIATLCVASFVLLTIGAAILACLPVSDATTVKYLPLILCYAPIYTLGLILGRFEDLRKGALADVRTPTVLVGLLVGADLLVMFYHPPESAPRMVCEAFMRSTLPGLGCFLILKSALSVRRVPDSLRNLSRASITIYIVHLPCLMLLQTLPSGLELHPYLRYFGMVGVAGAASWLFHTFLVERSRTLLWLFSGRKRPRGVSSPAPVPVGCAVGSSVTLPGSMSGQDDSPDAPASAPVTFMAAGNDSRRGAG